MSSRLREAIISRDKKALKQAISSFTESDNWSFITVIDELLPLMLMESNLRYGSFHTVKMNLFLRRLALEGYFSKETEKRLLKLIAFEMTKRDGVGIYADRRDSIKQDTSSTTERFIKELDKCNVHNAFYYALDLMEKDPNALAHLLLKLGANAIPKSLGHSISCFYPVVEDMIIADNPYTDTALLTYVMYLARYDANEDMIHREYGLAEEPVDYGKLLKICSFGTGIVEVHHTITFYLLTEWEKAYFNPDGAVPYGLLADWIGEKEADKDREHRATEFTYSEELPETYEEFASKFSFEQLDDSLSLIFRLLEKQPKASVDWLFRIYASQYADSWDPHYYTSLYSALRLYMEDVVDHEVACRMALDQALHYFAEKMDINMDINTDTQDD
jgi:hypothetical protein